MNLDLFISTFGFIFLAELPDKTAFATVIMAARNRALAVFFGVAAAFLVQTLVALVFGSVFAMLPPTMVHAVAGLIFLFFAVHLWRTRGDEEAADTSEPRVSKSFWISAWRAFLVIFIAEWGDLTQIATASLVAKFPTDRYTIAVASVLALWSVTAVAVLLGQKLKTALNPTWLKAGCAVICLIMAAYFAYEILLDNGLVRPF